jgi:DNA-binding SARP family transcriptional activator
MEFGILGPLEVRADGRAVALGGAKPRALLAMLLTHANQPVSAERLALALWGEDAPAGAVKTVQVHVSRLRKALADPDVLVTTPAGYCLRVDPGQLDAERFERQLTAGRQALAGERVERAAEQLRDALALWRGAPLAEFAWAPFAPAEIRRLEELRLTALEERVEADLLLGLHGSLIGELEALVAANPTHERFAEQLMLALYRCGRQADALAAYQRTRTRLTEDLGLEPGSALKSLQAAILDQAPSLVPEDPAHAAVTTQGERVLRRRRVSAEAAPFPAGSDARRRVAGRADGRKQEDGALIKGLAEHRLVTLIGRVFFVCAATFALGSAVIGITGATRADDDDLRAAINALRREGREAEPVRSAILEYVNGERLASGSPALQPSARLQEVGQAVARRDAIHAKPEIGTIREAVLDMGWNRVDESVAASTEWPKVPPKLLDEPHEHEVMTSNDYTQVGIGVAFDGKGRMWIHAVVAS